MALTGYEVLTYTAGPFGYDEETPDALVESGSIDAPAGKRVLGVTSRVATGFLRRKAEHISADGRSVAWELSTYGWESPDVTVEIRVVVADIA